MVLTSKYAHNIHFFHHIDQKVVHEKKMSLFVPGDQIRKQ